MGNNVFREFGFGDEDATVLALKTDVAIVLARYVRGTYPANQTAAAKALSMGQNEVSALLRANIARFSLEKLLRLARRAGLRIFLDMGDNAYGANAVTLSPTVVQSGVVVGGNLSVESAIGYENLPSTISRTPAKRTAGH